MLKIDWSVITTSVTHRECFSVGYGGVLEIPGRRGEVESGENSLNSAFVFDCQQNSGGLCRLTRS